ncbi:MAG: hypothetical protein WBQ94_04210 [Terracidiphilus sp.]
MRRDLPGIGGSLGECVLCGESFAFEVLLGKAVNMIEIKGFSKELPIHGKCLTALEANGKDWRTLPEGPLRREFAKAAESVKP